MRYSYLDGNDFVNGEGTSVSLWLQGCPHHCKGCHNPETWDLFGGTFIQYEELADKISDALNANGVHRNFSLLGGEPLAPMNIYYTNLIGYYVQLNHKDSKIYLWTGYTMEELNKMDKSYRACLDWADVIIDGRYHESERDVALKLRGSKNQRIWRKIDGKWKVCES